MLGGDIKPGGWPDRLLDEAKSQDRELRRSLLFCLSKGVNTCNVYYSYCFFVWERGGGGGSDV